jgi:deferrochelatase/peroxidase EfeB
VTETTRPVIAPDPATIQATILKGHGRNFAAHAFVRHRDLRVTDLRRLVEAVGVTSAAAQAEATARWRADPTFRSPPVHVVALSASGLRALGVDEEVLPGAAAFWAGMAARAGELGDPPEPSGPLAGGAEVLVVLADDSERVLEADLDRLHQALPTGAAMHVEWGQTIRRPGAVTTYEPFGFADGISEPELVPPDGWAPSSAIWWRPTFPLEQVLVPWRGGAPSPEWASFLVFRKLQQHPERFRAAMASAGQAAGVTPDEAASRAVGRYRDGTPRAEATPGSWNDFTYALDPAGARCPVSAHIRVVNPRASTDRHRLIARRGMPYRSIDGDEVGLLFLAFMADVEGQFEWMQRRANGSGDRIAGQTGGAAPVTMRGGDYFVVPPVPYFARRAH